MNLLSFKHKKKEVQSPEEKFGKISFSQCGEDMIVKHIFQAIGILSPSFIDIGAHHPFYMNNTAMFSLEGAKGINIEPDPNLFKQFPVYRKNDVNLNIGIGDKEDEQNFYIINVPTLNTFSKETAEEYQHQGNYKIIDVKKIKTDTISNILLKYANGIFPDFLTIDAEGVDELILNSIDFENNNCPTVICIETLSFSEKGRGEKNKSIIQLLESKGYLLYADTNINSIFVLKSKWYKQQDLECFLNTRKQQQTLKEVRTNWDNFTISEQNRIGDHIWYISDLTKFKSHYPDWGILFPLNEVIHQMVGFEKMKQQYCSQFISEERLEIN